VKGMSIEEFRALTRANKLGLPEPTPKKKRRKQRTFQEQEIDRKGARCPPGCQEGRELYHRLTLALAALESHRRTHSREK